MTDQQRIAEIRARAACGLESYRKKYPANWRWAYIFDGDRDTLWLLSQLAAKDKELERLTEALRWIPVTERLPEIGKCVLVRQTYHPFRGEHGEFEEVTVGYLHQPTDKRHKPYFYWVAVSDYGDMVRAESMCPGSKYITHWMPLPAAPDHIGGANEMTEGAQP